MSYYGPQSHTGGAGRGGGGAALGDEVVAVAAFVSTGFVVDEDAGKGHGDGGAAFFEAAGEDAGLRVDPQGGGFHRRGDADGVWLRESEVLHKGSDE